MWVGDKLWASAQVSQPLILGHVLAILPNQVVFGKKKNSARFITKFDYKTQKFSIFCSTIIFALYNDYKILYNI